jgi:glycerophosphoryl diester phosphodiesterase
MSDIVPKHIYNLRSLIQQHDRFIVAHRGSSGTAPENTMSSIRSAIEAGALMVEVDVQLTKDDHVILMHDPVLGRTTNGKGYIRTKTLQELQLLDAGTWFNPQFSGEHIPLLSEALLHLKQHQTCVNIEIKPPQKDDDHIARLLAIIESVHELDMQAGIHLPNDKRLPSEIASEIGCEGFVCALRELTHAKASDAEKHGILLGVYTINNETDFHKVMKYPVPALVSNFPKTIQEFLQHTA